MSRVKSSRAGNIPETNKGESGGVDEVMYCTSGHLFCGQSDHLI